MEFDALSTERHNALRDKFVTIEKGATPASERPCPVAVSIDQFPMLHFAEVAYLIVGKADGGNVRCPSALRENVQAAGHRLIDG